jgi:uncharacterized lipoprotein NlpE involved in copper resistance
VAYLTKLIITIGCGIPFLLLGCGRTSERADTSNARRADVSMEPEQKAIAISPPWFADEREIDLTGDAKPDTARLEAVGPTVDSLQIVFTIHSGGNIVYRNTWNSI